MTIDICAVDAVAGVEEDIKVLAKADPDRQASIFVNKSYPRSEGRRPNLAH